MNFQLHQDTKSIVLDKKIEWTIGIIDWIILRKQQTLTLQYLLKRRGSTGHVKS